MNFSTNLYNFEMFYSAEGLIRRVSDGDTSVAA